jgi:hypothetical protein
MILAVIAVLISNFTRRKSGLKTNYMTLYHNKSFLICNDLRLNCLSYSICVGLEMFIHFYYLIFSYSFYCLVKLFEKKKIPKRFYIKSSKILIKEIKIDR